MASSDDSLNPAESLVVLMEHVHQRSVNLERQDLESARMLSDAEEELQTVIKGLEEKQIRCSNHAQAIFHIREGMQPLRKSIQELDDLIDREADAAADQALAVCVAKLKLSGSERLAELSKRRLLEKTRGMTIPKVDRDIPDDSSNRKEEIKDLEEVKDKLDKELLETSKAIEAIKANIFEILGREEEFRKEEEAMNLAERKQEQQKRINENKLRAKTVRLKKIRAELKKDERA